jgi:hypothetical protein
MPLVAAAAVAAGAALQSATGFGFSVVAAPLVFAAVGPQEAVGLLLVLGTEVNLLTLASAWCWSAARCPGRSSASPRCVRSTRSLSRSP